MENKEVTDFFLRYIIIVIFGLFNLTALYFLFEPLTVYPTYFVLFSFDNSAKLLEGNIIFFSNNYIEIIPACIAGAAYYLLIILNLSTPMPIKKRLKSMGFLLSSFLIFNILRILFFVFLFVQGGVKIFEVTHQATWYIGSTIFVIILWFLNVWLFKIENIPIYTDFKEIIKEIKLKI